LLLDTNSFVYFLNNISPYVDVLTLVFERVLTKQASMIVSVVTESELLVLPTRNRDPSALADIEDLLSEDGIHVMPVDRAIARRAAELRTLYGALKLPDAMIVASAIHYGCDLIVGNDRKWKMIKDIPYLFLDDFIKA
jgi:predicted nucleic acid-binding protein